MGDEELEKQQDAEDNAEIVRMKCTARLQIREAGTMTEEGKLEIAEWLRHQAEMLLSDGHNYSFLFTARYNPED